MTTKDEFGDRLKGYENKDRFLPGIPVIARLDGRNFHNWTKGLDRPFDEDLADLMIDTTKHLVEETNALMGYTQSDEITLTWIAKEGLNQVPFDGKVQKMVSVLASMCTAYFNLPHDSDAGLSLAFKNVRERKDRFKPAQFDCRVFQVPDLDEGANVFLWRELDASKNSVSMAAHHYFSHNSLQGMHTKEMQEKLFSEKGINWNNYPNKFKRGTFIQRKSVKKKFSAEEIESLPPLHNARKNPDLEFERHEIKVLDMPKFITVANRADVIYYGAEPWT